MCPGQADIKDVVLEKFCENIASKVRAALDGGASEALALSDSATGKLPTEQLAQTANTLSLYLREHLGELFPVHEVHLSIEKKFKFTGGMTTGSAEVRVCTRASACPLDPFGGANLPESDFDLLDPFGEQNIAEGDFDNNF